MKENRFNEENPKPGYYAILTAAVRYDTNLLASEKLLFAEITALCNEKGYCYASNSYFADLYNTTVRTVSAWVSSLGKAGHITYVIDVENGNKRKIYLTGKMPDIQPQKIKKVKKEKKQTSIGIEADFYRVTKQTSIPIEADFNTSNSISNSISNTTTTIEKEKIVVDAENNDKEIYTEYAKQLMDDTLNLERQIMAAKNFKMVEVPELVRAFCLMQLANETPPHKNYREFRSHLFNWIGRHKVKNPNLKYGVPKKLSVDEQMKIDGYA